MGADLIQVTFHSLRVSLNVFAATLLNEYMAINQFNDPLIISSLPLTGLPHLDLPNKSSLLFQKG